jgi:hypothetical protein
MKEIKPTTDCATCPFFLAEVDPKEPPFDIGNRLRGKAQSYQIITYHCRLDQTPKTCYRIEENKKALWEQIQMERKINENERDKHLLKAVLLAGFAIVGVVLTAQYILWRLVK